MSFTYTAGTAVDYSGVLSFPSGIRFGGDDGSFRLLVCPPITDSVPLRVPSGPAPRGGGLVGDPLLDLWEFDVQGWFLTDDIADVHAGIEYLHARVNAHNGWQTVTLNAPGWAAARTMTVRVAGSIVVDPRDKGDMTVPERNITIPLIAADPRRYGAAVTTAITTGTSVTNAGNLRSPFQAVFVGPLTDALLDGPGTGNKIGLTTVASGQTITVTTVDPETGTMALSDNLGTDAVTLQGLLVNDDADYIEVGTESWTFTKSAGTGTASIIVKPAF